MAARTKAVHVGAPACFALEMACKHLNKAFGGQCYLVGSALERSDWRDIDVRLMMDDSAFAALFPGAGVGHWEFDPRWLLMTMATSAWLTKETGLPVDFQFQPTTHTNNIHKGQRNPLGITFASVVEEG